MRCFAAGSNVEEEQISELVCNFEACSAALEDTGRVLDSLWCAFSFARAVDQLSLHRLRDRAADALDTALAAVGAPDMVVIEVVDKAARLLSLFRGQPCPYALPTAFPKEPEILRRYSHALDHLQTLSNRRRRYNLSPEMRERSGRLSIYTKRRPSSREAWTVQGDGVTRGRQRHRSSGGSSSEEHSRRDTAPELELAAVAQDAGSLPALAEEAGEEFGEADGGEGEEPGTVAADGGAVGFGGGISDGAGGDDDNNDDDDGDDDDCDDDDCDDYLFDEDSVAMGNLRAASSFQQTGGVQM